MIQADTPIVLSASDPAYQELGLFFDAHGYGRFIAAEFSKQFGHHSYQAVIIQKSDILGALLFRLTGAECEIIEIAVAPAYRRKNLARRMMDDCVKSATKAKAERLMLEVADHNAPAKAFYQNYGFKPIGRRPRYYSDDAGGKIDAIIMELWLSKA